VVGDVIRHEGLDEVVAVVIARLHPELELLAARLADNRKILGVELLGQKLVLVALVDENRSLSRPKTTQFASGSTLAVLITAPMPVVTPQPM
jgi:hypothetical protein